MGKYKLMAEMKRFTSENKRQPTEEEAMKISNMISDLDAAVESKEITETEAMSRDADINYEILGSTKTPLELYEIGMDYYRQINKPRDREYMRLSKKERESRAFWYVWEKYGITARHAKALHEASDTLLTFEVLRRWEKD